MFTIEISYNFLYVWICMELYEKKFTIYDNCMLSIFGQPGKNKGSLLVAESAYKAQNAQFGLVMPKSA